MHTEPEHENDLPLNANDVLKTMLVEGGIWTTPPPSIEPEIMLLCWSVFELPSGSRHFVGYNAPHHEGRVSTAILAWNAERRQGITRSGRRYRLVGSPGQDADGLYVWSHLSKGSAYVDVTSEYMQDGA